MKKLSSFAYLVVLICLSFTSCEDAAYVDKLLGTWSGADAQNTIVLTFKSGHKFEMQQIVNEPYFLLNGSGTYTCTESTFILNYEIANGEEFDFADTFRYTMEPNGKTMTIYDVYNQSIVLNKY